MASWTDAMLLMSNGLTETGATDSPGLGRPVAAVTAAYRRISVRQPGPHHPGVTCKATASYPLYIDQDRAVAALRGDLRLAASRYGAAPDWSTLRVTGPTEVIGAHGIRWYEWAATVDATRCRLTSVAAAPLSTGLHTDCEPASTPEPLSQA